MKVTVLSLFTWKKTKTKTHQGRQVNQNEAVECQKMKMSLDVAFA